MTEMSEQLLNAVCVMCKEMSVYFPLLPSKIYTMTKSPILTCHYILNYFCNKTGDQKLNSIESKTFTLFFFLLLLFSFSLHVNIVNGNHFFPRLVHPTVIIYSLSLYSQTQSFISLLQYIVHPYVSINHIPNLDIVFQLVIQQSCHFIILCVCIVIQ